MDQDIREDLVSKAVDFLRNPKVVPRQQADKEVFLKKKGLTDQEIAVALDRVGTAVGFFPPEAPLYRAVGSVVPSQRSRWTIIRDISSTIIVVVSASYGAKYVYKKYIAPLLYGDDRRKSLEESLIESNQAVLRTLSEMTAALQNMQETMRILLERPSTSSAATSAEIREIKAELVSLKGLLLSRKQFPTPPALGGSTSLPSWQLQQIAEVKTKGELEVKTKTSNSDTSNEEDAKEKKSSSDSGSSEIVVLSALGSEDES